MSHDILNHSMPIINAATTTTEQYSHSPGLLHLSSLVVTLVSLYTHSSWRRPQLIVALFFRLVEDGGAARGRQKVARLSLARRHTASPHRQSIAIPRRIPRLAWAERTITVSGCLSCCSAAAHVISWPCTVRHAISLRIVIDSAYPICTPHALALS